MIKSRRESARSSTSRRPAARKPTAADKAAGRQRATRTAKINARRGIQQNAEGKPSAMEIEREVYRQTRMNNTPAKGKNGPRSRKDSAAQVKARKTDKKKKQQQQQKGAVPPTWVAGTRRPPSKKAVSAAVHAMTDAGFKVPQGMQMVISFAPAPDTKPPANQKKGGQQNKGGPKGGQNKGGNANKGKQNKGRGGGRQK